MSRVCGSISTPNPRTPPSGLSARQPRLDRLPRRGVGSLLYALARVLIDLLATSRKDQARLQAEVLALRRQVHYSQEHPHQSRDLRAPASRGDPPQPAGPCERLCSPRWSAQQLSTRSGRSPTTYLNSHATKRAGHRRTLPCRGSVTCDSLRQQSRSKVSADEPRDGEPF